MVRRTFGRWAFALMSALLWPAAAGAQGADAGEASSREDAARAPREQVAASSEELRELKASARDLSRVAGGVGRDWQRKEPPLSVEAAAREAGARDPARLLEWVREHIAHEPYQAALRAPRGVLVARRANAVDQARLLRAMYQAAGHEARLAWGELPEVEARRLLVEFAGKAALERDGAPLEIEGGADGFEPRHLQQVREHVWVEVRHRGRFQAADPLTGGALGTTKARRQGGGAEVPRAMRSTLQIQLVAQLGGGRRDVLLEHGGELAELAWRTFSLEFTPDVRLPHATRPVWRVGGSADVGKYFPRAELESLMLRFDMRTGRRRQIWEQSLYRGTGGADAFAFDQQHLAITVLPGWVSDAVLARVGASGFEEGVGRLKAWADEVGEGGEAMPRAKFYRQTRQIIEHTARVFPYTLARHLDRLTFALGEVMGVAPILSAPRVIVTSLIRDRERLYMETAIQGDLLDAIPALGVPAGAASGLVTLVGRIENELQGELLGSLVESTPYTTAALFDAAIEARVPVTTGHAGAIQAFVRGLKKGQPEELVEELREEVTRRGQVVLVPRRGVELGGVARHGWWAIDPLSGGLHGGRWHGLLNITGAARSAGAESQGQVMLALARMLTRQLSTWMAALKGSSAHERLVCQARADVAHIGQALCATREARPMPELEACLAPQAPGESGGSDADPLAMKMPSCDEAVRPTRCGAVLARAFLSQDLRVVRGEAADESSSPAASGGLRCGK